MDTLGLLIQILFMCAIQSIAAASVNERTNQFVDFDQLEQPSNDSIAEGEMSAEARQLYDVVDHAAGYDVHLNSSNHGRNVREENSKRNNTSVKVFISPGKSAVIQAIPRKLRGSGGISSTTSTTTSLPFARSPNVHTTAKDHRNGEPTTTIVYATSIPTAPTRTYVNIRPVPLLQSKHHRIEDGKPDPNSTKLSADKVNDGVEQHRRLKPQLIILDKQFKAESSTEQTPSVPASYEPMFYPTDQRKKGLHKNIPYARIRTNEDLDDVSNYDRNPYPNHKWTMDDYVKRMPMHLPPQPQAPPPAPAPFVYENHHKSHHQQSGPYRYSASQFNEDEMYRSVPPYSLPQSPSPPPRKPFQPLTVRDFELLLQLLVLREQRLYASQDPYSSLNNYVNEMQTDNGYYYDTAQPPLPSNEYQKQRMPKYFQGPPFRPQQQFSSRLLPSNVREELLFRLLMLSLHLQPMPSVKPLSGIPHHNMLRVPIMYSQPSYMNLESPISVANSHYGDFAPHSDTSPKGSVRSVQILGEIE